MQNLQYERSTQRRKSGLSISSFDFLSDNGACESDKEWMTTSQIETKCARHTTDCARDLSWDAACRIEDSKKCCSNVCEQCEINQDVFLSNSDLLKSINFCSPILKEDKGSEPWRDFLWSCMQDHTKIKDFISRLSCFHRWCRVNFSDVYWIERNLSNPPCVPLIKSILAASPYTQLTPAKWLV